jgi:hypothetical protein
MAENKFFDVGRYQDKGQTLVDGSDALANKKELVISFYHESSGRSVYFKAFITAFTETYNSNFTPHEAFGRTDPIYQYKNTTRKMSLTFEVPAASEGEAYENLGRVSALEQMLYANYSEIGSATTISQAPLVRMKVMNLAQSGFGDTLAALSGFTPDQEGLAKEEPRKLLYESYKTNPSPSSGLLGIIDNLSVNHNINGDDGVFHKMRPIRNDEGQVIGQEPVPNTILPKNIELSLAFSPIHETTLGWNKYDTQINNLFPYGVVTDDTMPEFVKNFVDYEINVYNQRVAKEKAEQEARELRQQNIDNATARYNGMLGGMRMRSDSRRSVRGNERASGRLENYTNALQDEALMDLGYDNMDAFIEDISK